MKSFSLLLTATALCIAAIGCRTAPTRITYLPDGESVSGKGANQKQSVNDANPLDKDSPIAIEPPIDNSERDPSTFKALTVHFDYDSSVVKSAEASKLRQIAEYLKANPSKALAIEGHCDEQGTEEYNRSLGDRRALALREALAKLDVNPSRLDTISYGKDRPVDTSRTQAANGLNRRGEFVVLTHP
jgi:outer membrane protein OmpA-like peptidoglycan-associated protein